MRWLVVAAVLATAPVVGAQSPPPGMDAVAAYFRDPLAKASRDALIALDHPGSNDAAPVVQLIIGVAYLRDGNAGYAARVFGAVANRTDAPTNIRQVAWNGFSWAELARGDFVTARVGLENANALLVNPLSTVLLGLLDASDGQVDTALARLTPLAADLRTAPSVRAVARYATAFARFHSGDFATAAAEFQAVADDPIASDLADDARYASGLALWRSGDHDAAIHIWEALVGSEPPDDHPAPRFARGLLRLDPVVWIRGGLRRLQTFPLAPQEVQLLRMLDRDGRAMARAMLDRVGHGAGDPSTRTADPNPEASATDPADNPTRPRVRSRRARLNGHSTSAAAQSGAGQSTPAGNGGGFFTTTAESSQPATTDHNGTPYPRAATRERPAPAPSHRRSVLAVLALVLLGGGLWLRRRPAPTSHR